MIGEDASGRLGWSTAKVSRIENAKTLPSIRDVEALLDLYGADRAKRDELIGLRRDAAQKGWWEEYREALPPDVLPLLGLEIEATEVRNWETHLVPGLLQTEGYATALVSHFQPVVQVPHRWLQDRVAARMERQRILLFESNPVTFFAVFEESVLRRRVGEAEVMREQLTHLMQISELEHVEMRILPEDAPPPMPTGPFLHLRFPDFPDIVYLEEFFGAKYIEDTEQVYAYERAFEHLIEVALDEKSSRELIRRNLSRW